MSDQNIKVCCRFRPVNKLETKSKGHKIIAKVANDCKSVQIGSSKKAKTFSFDYIFPSDSNQQTVYNYSALPLVDSVLAGYNCTLFAYGQTGSGKTYSMEGIIGDSTNEGLIPRMIRTIFDRILDDSNEVTFEYTVRVSFVEIYNEKLRDLLQPHGGELKIREKNKTGKGVYIENVHSPFVGSPEEVFDHLNNGHVNRSVASTRMNEHSSRSHAIFMLQIDAKNTETGSSKASKLMMVDLAGSEKVKKTKATGQTLKEAQQINKSLMVLGLVINSLVENKKHVPYRDSKLTRLLSDALGGNSKTCLIVTASPSKYNQEETVSTLRFGNRAKSIQNTAKINQELSVNEYKKLLEKAKKREEIYKQQIRSLQAQNDALKQSCITNKIDVKKILKHVSNNTHKIASTQALVTMVPQSSNKNENIEQIETLQKKLDQISDEKSNMAETLGQKQEELEDTTQELNELHTHLQEMHVQMDELKKRYEELYAAKNHVDKLFQSINTGKDANKERYSAEKQQWDEDRLGFKDELRVKNNTIQEFELKLKERENQLKEAINNNNNNNQQQNESNNNKNDDQKQNEQNNILSINMANENVSESDKQKKKDSKAQMIALVDTARRYRSMNEKNAEEIKKLREKLKAYKRRDEVNKQLRDNWNKQLNQMEQAVLLANEIYNRERTRHEAEMAEKDVEILKLRKFLLSFTNRHSKSTKTVITNGHNTHNGHSGISNNLSSPRQKQKFDMNAPGSRKSKIVVPKVIKAGAIKLKTRTFNNGSIKKKSRKRNESKMDQ